MSDTTPSVPSPNANKTVGSSVGSVGGGFLGVGIVALLHIKYPTLAPEAAAAIAAIVAGALGTVGTFFAPLLTAAQNRAVRALDGSASTDQKTVQKIAVAQAIVSAASTFPATKPPA